MDFESFPSRSLWRSNCDWREMNLLIRKPTHDKDDRGWIGSKAERTLFALPLCEGEGETGKRESTGLFVSNEASCCCLQLLAINLELFFVFRPAITADSMLSWVISFCFERAKKYDSQKSHCVRVVKHFNQWIRFVLYAFTTRARNWLWN